MRSLSANFDDQDRMAFHAAVAFLQGRLEERATIDWALRLPASDHTNRLALLDVINSHYGRQLREPWRSAWLLIEESWANSETEDEDSAFYDIERRLKAGDRSGSLIAAIASAVSPRLKVEALSKFNVDFDKPLKSPKKFDDLLSAVLTSGQLSAPGEWGLENVRDKFFLRALAVALEAGVAHGLDIARRLGWGGEHQFRQLGGLHRVYYVQVAEPGSGMHEPDAVSQGIAPSVKLLYAVVSRLVDIDTPIAIEFAARWKSTNSPVHLRLWTALSLDPRVTSAAELGVFLLSISDWCFWNINDYPEIAELRAKRFRDLSAEEQTALGARIQKRPPRLQWPRKADPAAVDDARTFQTVRELRRIELASAILPTRQKAWLEANITKFPDLIRMNRLDEGFLISPRVRAVPANPDGLYDTLSGEERLKALEIALSSASGWDDDPGGRAWDWIREPGNLLRVLGDLESVPAGGAAFAHVWERFGWAHSPSAAQEPAFSQSDLTAESSRVLSLIAKLPDRTVRQALGGISHWFGAWEKQVAASIEGLNIWLKLWPIAVEVTNSKQLIEDETPPNRIALPSHDNEPRNLDTLDTPVGKLVKVFLAACPTVRPGDAPFAEDNVHKRMRNAIEDSIGPAGLIVKYRLIEGIHYFAKADIEWTTAKLLPPLLEDSADARILWRAVANRTRFLDVLKIIGTAMTARATDRRLGRKTKNSLVFSLVFECLYAFWEHREPAVPYVRIQQMLRSLDDEIRSSGANAVQLFVHGISPSQEGIPFPSPEQLLRTAAAPFLQRVWPQERSLTTRGVSRELARLPARAGDAFAEAVDAIERFLVPFDCWSMIEYGLYGQENGEPKLSKINNDAKAAAFLKLLDLTIGTAERSIIPNDLTGALEQILRTAPSLAKDPAFRRLATAARRGQ